MRSERETAHKRETDELRAKASKWKSTIIKDNDPSSGGEARSSGGAEQSSEGVSLAGDLGVSFFVTKYIISTIQNRAKTPTPAPIFVLCQYHLC